MSSHKIEPADEAHLKFLRSQVDQLEAASFAKDAPSDTAQRLFYARQELREFVEGKRRQGYTI